MCMNPCSEVARAEHSSRKCSRRKVLRLKNLAMIVQARSCWVSARSTTAYVNMFLKIIISWYLTHIGIPQPLPQSRRPWTIPHMKDFQIINRQRPLNLWEVGHKHKLHNLLAEASVLLNQIHSEQVDKTLELVQETVPQVTVSLGQENFQMQGCELWTIIPKQDMGTRPEPKREWQKQ